jgi:hypothetical protein
MKNNGNEKAKTFEEAWDFAGDLNHKVMIEKLEDSLYDMKIEKIN